MSANPDRRQPATTLPCPRCGVFLFGARAGDLVLRGCGACGGIWVDNAGSAALVQRAAPGAVALADLAAKGATAEVDVRTTAACPECRTTMRQVRDPRSGVDLDVCEAHGTWFDARELQRVSRAYTFVRRPAPPHDRPLDPSEIPDFRAPSQTGDLGAVLGALGKLLEGLDWDD